jgi:hypothetical protein
MYESFISPPRGLPARSTGAVAARPVAARRPTGSFLRAILENDLREACVRADVVNRYELATIVLWLHHYVTSTAWGSPEKVTAWLADPEAPVPEVFE